MKTCWNCKATKPLTEFYRKASTCDGLTDECRECAKTRARLWYHANKERARETSKAWRLEHTDHLQKYRQSHKAQRQQNMREWRKDNSEHIREYKRAWSGAHPEAARERTKRWAKVNRERALLNSRKGSRVRRERLAKATSGPVDMNAVLQRHGLICHICRNPIHHERISFDHIVPLSRGGLHVEENLAPAHLRCNSLKGTKILTSHTPMLT